MSRLSCKWREAKLMATKPCSNLASMVMLVHLLKQFGRKAEHMRILLPQLL